eukprot:6174986-Pleurochrysis_carterae.AAC.2
MVAASSEAMRMLILASSAAGPNASSSSNTCTSIEGRMALTNSVTAAARTAKGCTASRSSLRERSGPRATPISSRVRVRSAADDRSSL